MALCMSLAVMPVQPVAARQITPPKPVEIKIDAQRLDKALNLLARQAGFQILTFSDDALGKMTRPINGRYTYKEALEFLLHETDLTYQQVEDGVFAVRSRSNDGDEVRKITYNEDSYYQENLAVIEEDEKDEELLEFEEIVVTGSHIRGVGLSVGSKVEIIDRTEIDRSGFATTQQLLQSMPINFGGGESEDTRLNNSSFTAGSSVNLRGLGTSSTLVLVNGRRVPVAGFGANFFDVSNIPTTAIKRIEVLPDGASAIYGADAIAGVVNIILRDDYEGAETRARFGTVTDGGSQEYQFGQVFGTNWETGNALISYEYYKRDSLGYEERNYTADSDLRPLGGEDHSQPFSNPANILSPLDFTPIFAIPAGQDGTGLSAADLIPIPPGLPNLQNANLDRDLFADQERHSVFLTASQTVAETIKLFAEGRYSKRDFRQEIGSLPTPLFVPASNPFFVDPFGGAPIVFLGYNFGEDIGPLIDEGDVESYNAVLGGSAELANDWRVRVYGSYSKENSERNQLNRIDTTALNAALADPDPATAFNPFGDGSFTSPATVEKIRTSGVFMSTSEIWSANLTADGALFQLPGGDVKLAAGVDYREETFKTLSTPSLVERRFEREVLALFGELFIPLFDEDNRRPGLERLIISAATRYEDYSDKRDADGMVVERDPGSTTNPKFGILWSPIEGLNIRGTWGESFRAPNLPTLGAVTNAGLAPMPDPKSPTGTTFVVIQGGTNPDLGNETATTWTLGADFSPSALPGLSLDVTYFNIDFKDRITAPPNQATILTEEDKFASIIIRDPALEDVLALCDRDDFVGDPVLCAILPIGATIDARTNNTARTQVEGLDFNIRYGFETANVGRFDFRINGNYLFSFKEAFSSIAPIFDLVDTVSNPVDFRMRNSVTWSTQDGFSATAYINYSDSYSDDVSIPERGIGSWTTVDLTLSFNSQDRFGKVGLNDTQFTLSIINLADNDPPFVNSTLGVGYDLENADPLGRFISFNITKKW